MRTQWLIVLSIFAFISAGIKPSTVVAEELVVGAILPLTGVAADYGISIRNCLELAKADRPELFKNLRIVYEDAAYDAKLAVSAFHKLREQNRVDLIYSWGVSFCKALAPLAEQHKLPFVGQCIDSESSRGRKSVIRFMNAIEEYQDATAEYLNKQGKKNIGIVLTDTAYLGEMLAAFERSLRPGQRLEIVDRFATEEMNFRSTISKLRHGNYDAVGVFLNFGQVSTFFKQMREQKYAPFSFGTNIFESASELRAAQGAMKGAIFSANSYHPEFAARYRSIFHNESQLAFGALAYEFMVSTGALMQGNESGSEILSKYRGISGNHGRATGPYSFAETEQSGQYIKFPVVVKRVTEDGVEVVQ